jgi:hypothetical protein
MISLVPHPSTPETAWTVSASAERSAENELRLRYRIGGAVDALRVPSLGAVRAGDRLWEHTCTEAFLGAESASGYVELNVSPSREWAAYAFTAYRQGGPPISGRRAPRIDVRRAPADLAIDVRVALADLSPVLPPDAVLRVGLTVVTEATDGRHAYWALHHPSARPDFHHADARTLRLEPAP